jgi:ribosomal protein S10
MPFVTKLRLRSGDRHELEAVVDDIKSRAERKGVELKGPHPKPPAKLRVPQSKRLAADGPRFPAWDYTVYERAIEVVGYEDFARSLAAQEYPDSIHVEAEIEQASQQGS